jgi:outer membrane protein assembly factor BamB
MTPSRRSFLAGGATGLLVGSAGCTDLRYAARERRLGTPERQVAPDWEPGPDSWPYPRYDPERTGYNPHAEPPREEPEEAWSWDGEAESMVVADESVYAYEDGEVLAIDADDGSERWRVDVGDVGRTLVAVDGRIYCTGLGVIALSPDGDRIWSTPLETGGVAGFIEREGWIHVIGVNGEVRRLHADSGDIVADGSIATETDLATDGGRVYAVGWDALTVYAFDGEELDRTLRGEFEGQPGRPLAPTVSNGSVFLPWRVERSGVDDGRLDVHDAETGEHSTSVEFSPEPGLLVATEALAVVTASTQNTAQLFAVDAETGEERWRHEADATANPSPRGRRSTSGPATGYSHWNAELIGRNRSSSRVIAGRSPPRAGPPGRSRTPRGRACVRCPPRPARPTPVRRPSSPGRSVP